jgi:hypothetical protein
MSWARGVRSDAAQPTRERVASGQRRFEIGRSTTSQRARTSSRTEVLDSVSTFVTGGWRDPWDDPDDSAELRTQAEAAERRQLARAERLGAVWRQERAGTPDASMLVQRSAGRELERSSRPAES